MTAYLIVDLDIHDPAGYTDYRTRVPEFIAKYGGEYLVRGGDFAVLEGDWKPHRLVLFKFPSRQAIGDMFADPDYKRLAEVRYRTSKSAVVAVDGVA